MKSRRSANFYYGVLTLIGLFIWTMSRYQKEKTDADHFVFGVLIVVALLFFIAAKIEDKNNGSG